jgi:hypothetical protein
MPSFLSFVGPTYKKFLVMKCGTIFVIAAICFLGIGCKSKTALDYNNVIVQKQQTLAKSMDQTEPQLKNYFANYQYDSIASVSARMEAQIDSIMHFIQSKPAPNVKQGANFKKAALNYFDYMKTVYTSYKNYGRETTPEGRIIGLAVISKVTSQEDNAIADMRQAQRIFAKDNGFKIKSATQQGNGSLTASPPK